ncbi:hypothetical protein N0V84_002717 [Fusarium piperis]|uniref:N-acetyltransferase domain-containing protein n=1 Tax=Fusarium piperis TaxID=1435070 RepID=A0A9W8WJI3_9HYPO|nr:hypothetical protein N0V84_002717 [Fusarium piperis]
MYQKAIKRLFCALTRSPLQRSAMTPCLRGSFVEEPDVDARQKRLEVFFKPVVKSGLVCGGYILDAAGWASMMVVSEPGQDYDGLSTIIKCGGIPATLSGGLRPTLRLLLQYLTQVDKVKLKCLPKSQIRECFYIMLTATEPAHRRQGLLSAQVKHLQAHATKVGKPVWLEATSRYSMSQFAKHGFEHIEDIRLGKGKVNAQGKREKGGEGVLIACMIWWPEGAKEAMGEEKSLRKGDKETA